MVATFSDYIIIGIVSLAIAFIMGMSIVSIIDKKLTDITINVPKPDVTVKISDCNKNIKEYKNQKTKESEEQEETGEIEEFQPTKDSAPKTNRKIKVNPVWLDKILDTEQYDDVEGYKQYAIMGCPDRTKKMKLYPNIVACSQPNYLTAENYYNSNFEYPYIPGQSEEQWVPANYDYTSYLAKPDVSIRIIARNKNKLSKKPPFPENYWFK